MNVSALRQSAENIHGLLTDRSPTFSVGVLLLTLVEMSRFYRAKRLTPEQIHTRTYLACSGHQTHRRHIKSRIYNLIRGEFYTEEQIESCVSLVASEMCSRSIAA